LFQENRFWDKLKRPIATRSVKKPASSSMTVATVATTNLPAGGGTLNEAGQQGYHKAGYKYKNFHQQVADPG
jgi:hypothetical protein